MNHIISSGILNPLPGRMSQNNHQTIFTVASIIAFIVIASFIVLIGKYIWQIQYGDPTQIAEKFSKQFSESSELTANHIPQNTIENISDIIRPHNPKLGAPNAPVTIIAFVDFECPFCQRSYPIFKSVIDQYTPGVQVIFKHLPLASIHPNATSAALASACAHEQDNFWPYYNQLFTAQRFSQSDYNNYATQLQLNTRQFTTCTQNKHPAKNIEQDVQDAVDLGVRGTPSYIINGRPVQGVISKDIWDTLIVQALQQ